RTGEYKMNSVFDPHQKKSLRRRGGAGGAAVARGEDFAGPGFRLLAAADERQRADDVADHVVEKPVGFDFDMEQVGTPLPCPAPLDGDFVDGANRAGPLGSAGLKAGEVVRIEEMLRGAAHRGLVEFRKH